MIFILINSHANNILSEKTVNITDEFKSSTVKINIYTRVSVVLSKAVESSAKK